MTRIGASQLAKHNINVNAICPGATRTDLYTNVMKQLTEREGLPKNRRSLVWMPRFPSSALIARMILPIWPSSLASDEARNITGQSFNVDGGLMWD